MFRYENTFSETSQIPDFLLAQMLHLMKRQVLERATNYGVMQPTLSATCSIFETNILKVMVLVEWLPYSAALLILSSCILVIISILLYISPTACPAYNMHRDFKHYLNYPNPFSSITRNVMCGMCWGGASHLHIYSLEDLLQNQIRLESSDCCSLAGIDGISHSRDGTSVFFNLRWSTDYKISIRLHHT